MKLKPAREMRVNQHEMTFEDTASRLGIKWHRSGWPDYVIAVSGAACLLEVKADKDCLRENQLIMFDILTGMGMKIVICLNGDLDKILSVNEYLKSKNLIRVWADNKFYLRPFNHKLAEAYGQGKIKLYHNHTWVFEYLGVKDARSTDHPK
jgi:hypothetical protein